MSYQLNDVVYELDQVWVLREVKPQCYTVFTKGITHSTSDSAYPLDDDGLSIAKARADWLNKRLAAKRAKS